jgi:pyruvate dehydrogenase E1 component
MAYDPAFSFEIAAIMEEGWKRMFVDQKNVIYYITVGNENYEQPAAPGKPEELKSKILKGLYLYRTSQKKSAKARVQLIGSGAILNEALAAAAILRKNTMWPPMSGAQRPGKNSGKRPWKSIATICCRARNARPTWPTV